jgi:hypothetical protein
MKPFKTAKMKIKARRANKIILVLNYDLCSGKKPKNEIEVAISNAFALNGICNHNETKFFCRKDTEILKLSLVIEMMIPVVKAINDNDKISVEIIINHDTGKTCFFEEHVIKVP